MGEHDLLGVLDGSHPRAPCPGLRMLPHAGLTAVLAEGPRPLMRLPQGRKAQLAGLAERLRLQEACMELATFLPASPQAHLSPEAAPAFLDVNRLFLFNRIARFASLAQYQVQVLWAEDRVLQHFRQDPDIAPLFTAPTSGEQIAAAVARLAARLGAEVTDALSLAPDLLPLPLAPGLIWNGALLLPRAAEAELDRVLERIDAIWTEGLTLRLTGPAPIVSFCLLEVERISQTQVDWALDRFGLAALDQAGEVPAMRRQLLMTEGAEAREEIDFHARVIEAAARLGSAQGLVLCHARADGTSLAPSTTRAVA